MKHHLRALPLALAACISGWQINAAASPPDWHFDFSNANLFVAASDPSCPATLLAGSEGRLMRSSDDGRHWQTLHNPSQASITMLRLDAAHQQFLAAASAGQLLRGTHCGTRW